MSTCVIVNGAAGGGRCAERVQPYLVKMFEAGLDPVVLYTAGPGDATRIAAETAADVVVAVGGDGTVFEVVNGLLPRPHRPALAVLPLGTGNSFVRDFGLQDPDAAMRALVQERRRSCDVVKAIHSDGELFYINLLSLGFTARAGAITNQRFKPLGAGGYILAVLASLVKMEHPIFPLRIGNAGVDDRACTLLSFSNSRYTGGDMMMAPDADPSDGLLDIIRIGPMGRRRFLGCFPRIFKGTHPELEEIEVSTATKVEFFLDAPTDVMVDGEVLCLDLRSVEVLPGALEVVA